MRRKKNTGARWAMLVVLPLIAASASVAGAADVGAGSAMTLSSSGLSIEGEDCGQGASSSAVAAPRLHGGYGAQIRGFVADRPYTLTGRLDLTSDGVATAKITEVLAGTPSSNEEPVSNEEPISNGESTLNGCWTTDASGTRGEIVFPPEAGRCRSIMFLVLREDTTLLLQCLPATTPGAVDGVAANGRALAMGDIPGSLQGTFSVQGEGFAATVPVALTGVVALKSDRRLSGTVKAYLIETQAGIRNDNSLTGGFSIRPDGIGEATLHAVHDPADAGANYEEDHHIRFVVVDDGRAALVTLLSDPGVTLTAQVNRM